MPPKTQTKQTTQKKITTTTQAAKPKTTTTTVTTAVKKKKRQRKNPPKKTLTPSVNVQQACRAWVDHMSDPFSVPPVSIGASGTPNYVWGAYGRVIIGSGGINTFNDFIAGLDMGSLANSSGASPVSSFFTTPAQSTSLFSSGTSQKVYYSNAANAATLFNTARPISAALRVSFHMTNAVNPPFLYAGRLATGSTINLFGVTPNTMITYPGAKMGSNTTYAMQANWVPQDFGDLSSFQTGWIASAPGGTTVPFIGATAMGAQSGMTILMEVISFWEYEVSTLALQQYLVASPQAGYSTNALWEEFIKMKAKGVTPVAIVENPAARSHSHGDKHGLGNMTTLPTTQTNPYPMPAAMDTSTSIAPSTVLGTLGALAMYGASKVLPAENLVAPGPHIAPDVEQKYNQCFGCGFATINYGLCSDCSAVLQTSRHPVCPECPGCQITVDRPGLCSECQSAIRAHHTPTAHTARPLQSPMSTPEIVGRTIRTAPKKDLTRYGVEPNPGPSSIDYGPFLPPGYSVDETLTYSRLFYYGTRVTLSNMHAPELRSMVSHMSYDICSKPACKLTNIDIMCAALIMGLDTTQFFYYGVVHRRPNPCDETHYGHILRNLR